MAQTNLEHTAVLDRLHKSWAPITTSWQQYRTTAGGNNPSLSELYSIMDSIGEQVDKTYDDLVDILGMQFARGDDAFQSDMSELEKGPLTQLYASLGGLSNNSNRRSDPSTTSKPESEKLATAATARSTQILEALASRLGYSRKRGQSGFSEQESLFDDTDDVDWCKGALLNQQSSTNYESTITQPAGKQSKTCKFCYLEIGDYRSKALGYTNEDWSALASCHVLAYSSFNDRRAAYRCYGCDVRGISKIQASVAAMSDHLASCSDFRERQARPQMPPRPNRKSARPPSSPPLTPRTSNSVSSGASIPSTDSTHYHGSRPEQPQYEDRAGVSNVPPTRNPPSVPQAPQTSRTKSSYTPRPDTEPSIQRTPGGFPAPQPNEPIYSYQPSNLSTSTIQTIPHTPQRSVPVHRKAVLPSDPSMTPQHPLMNPSQSKRTGSTTYLPDASPPVTRAPPAQVRQLMELGASRSEAEGRLQESNWDVQEAADLYLNSSMARRQ